MLALSYESSVCAKGKNNFRQELIILDGRTYYLSFLNMEIRSIKVPKRRVFIEI